MKRRFQCVSALVLTASAALAVPGIAEAEDSKAETRIYTLPDCPATGTEVYKPGAIGGIAPFVAGLLSAVISPLIEGVVDKGVNALKDAAKDKDFRIPSPEPLMREFYEVGVSGETAVNPQIGCVVLVRSEFEKGNYPSSLSKVGDSLTDRIAAKFRVWAGSGMSPAAGDPYIRVKPGTLELYFEIRPVISPDGKMLGFRPQALHVGSFASKDGFFGSSQRKYLLTLTFADPYGSQAFASGDFKYEGVEKGFSKEACVTVPAKTYCTATELGGIRGWYATKPISDDFAPIIKKRQASAVTLKTAITAWTAPPARPKAPDDTDLAKSPLAAYCTALESSNKLKLAGNQLWDEQCPPAFGIAKRDYLYAAANAAAWLDKQKADEFWSKKCIGTDGKALPLNDTGLVDCLKVIAGKGNQTVLAGQFLVSSTIVETRPGNKLAAFLAPIAEKEAPALKTALKEKLDPIEREKAAAAAAAKAAADSKTKMALLNAVTLADDAVKAAQITYQAALDAQSAANPPDSKLNVAAITAHIALINAQIASNDAYRAADLPLPFPVVG